jgi:hypothetical protein
MRTVLGSPAGEPTIAAAKIHNPLTIHVRKQPAKRWPFRRAGQPLDRARQLPVAFEKIGAVVNVLRHVHDPLNLGPQRRMNKNRAMVALSLRIHVHA